MRGASPSPLFPTGTTALSRGGDDAPGPRGPGGPRAPVVLTAAQPHEKPVVFL